MRNQGYLKQFSQRLHHIWNILGLTRDLRLFHQDPNFYDFDEESDEEKFSHRVNCFNICQQFVPSWKELTADDVYIVEVTGGLTNKLTKVAIKQERLDNDITPIDPPCLLVRHYGVGTETFFERENEHKIFEEFSRRGIGPLLYGFFDGGRVEEFMSARNVKGYPEIKTLLATIGETMAAMHQCEMDIPKKPMVFENLFQWLETARGVTFKENETEKKKLYDTFNFNEIEKELEKLKTRLEDLGSPICFCHNDLLAGNMMFEEKTKQVFFIDYEYGSYNYRGFDFGNFFCECTIDYSVPEHPKFRFINENYPNVQEQRILFASYLHHTKKLQGKANLLPTESEIRKIAKESNEFALAATLIWCFWGIIQSSTSDIDFGYLEFAQARLVEYHRLKDILDKDAKVEKKAHSKALASEIITIH